jgi:hypothetical protein
MRQYKRLNMKTKLSIGVVTGLALLVAAAWAADNAPTISLFNGKDLTGWKTVGTKKTNQWVVGQAALDPADPGKLVKVGPGDELISPEKGLNLATEAAFQDCRLELEFMMAKNSNSGVKMMNIYEIQLLDSYGKAVPDKGDCGAVYKESAPKVNACKPAGEWQSLELEFRAPRFDAAGKKISNACFEKVTMNGQVIQEKVELTHGTNMGTNMIEHALGPVYLQGDHGPVAFRHFKLTPLNKEK